MFETQYQEQSVTMRGVNCVV